nr:polyketide synthase [Sulfitobacter alexandrii]
MDRVPIAVVGMACRFPGADSVADLADMLRTGRIGTGPVPSARLALMGTERLPVRAVGLVDNIDSFDRHPFRISGSEAPLLDPQQRLVLEMAWHALEDAGLSPANLDGTSAGVYVGVASSDHAMQIARTTGFSGNAHLPNAVQNAAVSGRVSYCLGLTGPSLTVDTACSSGLTAVTQAGDALRLGHCDIALAGGVNVLLNPAGFMALGKMNVLSRTGQTHPFEARADGFVRSEGCGIVVLKRLPDALADHDRIHAVLPGWATGQDGRSNGLSAPSRAGQVRVITRAMRSAGVTVDDIGAIEAHGSATAVGDAIETLALAEVFADRKHPSAALGSIKAAVGHLEAAAGIAGLIKAVLMVRDNMLPGQSGFENPSPRIDWKALPLHVPLSTGPWQSPRRIAGVSSFGISGLNCHAIVCSAEDCAVAAPSAIARSTAGGHLFLLSAASPAALCNRARQLLVALDNPQVCLRQLSAMVTRRWVGLSLRAGFQAGTIAEARAAAGKITSEPTQVPERLVGPVMLETPEPLSHAAFETLCRACPDLVAPDAGRNGAVTVRCPTGEIPAALLGLHLAGAALDTRAVTAADPTAPDLPGYPFDRRRCWYVDTPPPQAAGK